MNSSSLSSWFHGLKGKLLVTALLPIIGFTIIFFTATINVSKMADMLDTAAMPTG